MTQQFQSDVKRMPSIHFIFFPGWTNKTAKNANIHRDHFGYSLFFITFFIPNYKYNCIKKGKLAERTHTMPIAEPNKMVRRAWSYGLSGAFKSSNKRTKNQEEETKITPRSSFGMCTHSHSQHSLSAQCAFVFIFSDILYICVCFLAICVVRRLAAWEQCRAKPNNKRLTHWHFKWLGCNST